MRLQTPKTVKSFNIVKDEHLQHTTPATTQDGLPTKPTDEQRLQNYFYSDAFVKLYLTYLSKDKRAVLIKKIMANKNDRHEALTSFITIKLPKLDSHITKWIDYIEADKVCYENVNHREHRAYIMTALTNFLTDEWRRQSAYKKKTVELKEEHDKGIKGNQYSRARIKQAIKKLDQLDERDRLIFVMSSFDNLSGGEIGKELGVSKQYVNFRLALVKKLIAGQ